MLVVSMPNYSYEHTFSPGTSKDKQEELEMPCHWGILRDVALSFPAGCHGVCHVHVDDSLHQIWPTNPERTYALDDWTLTIEDTYELLPATRKIYLRGWNEGIYPHKISVSFTVSLEGRYTPAEQIMLRLVKILERLLGMG